MAENGKKKTDDRIFEHLLKGYERNTLSPEEKAELITGLKAASGGESGLLVRKPAHRPGFIIAAAAALVLVLGTFLLFYSAPLVNPVTVAEGGRDEVCSEAGVITAPHAAEAELRSETEYIVLSPGTALAVKGAPLRRLSGETENTYSIADGDIYIEHSEGSFRLETDYGMFTPAGTVISCSVSPGVVSLVCLEGRMRIRPERGAEFFLEEGYMLTAQKADGRWRHEVREITARIDFYLPESRVVAEEKAEPSGWMKIWSAEIPGFVTASVSAERLYVYSRNSLSSYDYSTGELLTEVELREEYEISSFYEDMFFGYLSGRFDVLSTGSGEVLWSLSDAPVVYAGFAVEDGKLYLPSVDGTLYIFGAGDGSGPVEIRSSAGLYGIPAVSGGAVVFSSIDKRISCVSIEERSLLWQTETEQRLMGDRPVFSEDSSSVLYWDEAGSLVLLDASDGKVLAESSFNPPMIAPPEASGEYFIYQDSGGLRGIGAQDAEQAEDGEVTTRIKSPAGGIITAEGAVIITPDGELERWDYR